jgi:excisionase family DNA binding protein
VTPQLLTKREAAEALHIGVRTLEKLYGDGRLEHVRVGGSVRFTVEALTAFIERSTVSAAKVRGN